MGGSRANRNFSTCSQDERGKDMVGARVELGLKVGLQSNVGALMRVGAKVAPVVDVELTKEAGGGGGKASVTRTWLVVNDPCQRFCELEQKKLVGNGNRCERRIQENAEQNFPHRAC